MNTMKLPALCSVSELGKNPSKYVAKVRSTEEVLFVTVNGKPVAALVPISAVTGEEEAA